MLRTDPFAPARGQKRAIAYDFVLDQLAQLSPTTRAMFGSTGVYLDERVVFILRKKGDSDDGVWLAFETEVEAEVKALFPALKPIERLGNVRCWRKLAADSESFEDDVLRACRLLCTGDQRLGKVPDRQKTKQKRATAASSKPRAEKSTASARQAPKSVKQPPTEPKAAPKRQAASKARKR